MRDNGHQLAPFPLDDRLGDEPTLDVMAVSQVPVQVRNNPTARVVPLPPLGNHGVELSAAEAMEMGALMGALGLEKGALSDLVQELQRVNMTAQLQALPLILDLMKRANDARLNRLVQTVRALPETRVTTIGHRWSGEIPISQVSRDAVIAAIQQAMNEPLNTRP